MKALISSSSLTIIGLWTALLPASAQVNVTQKNNNLSRDGLYINAAFTPGNAANLTRDLNFIGNIVGNVHAQPLARRSTSPRKTIIFPGTACIPTPRSRRATRLT